MPLQKRPSELIGLLRSEFKGLFNPASSWGDIASNHLLLDGLAGFWPLTSRDENGDVYDLSGQGRTLTAANSPAYTHDGLRTYVTMVSGSSQVLFRSDEPGLDITGGLTLGCWLYINTLQTSGIIGKWNTTGDQRSYQLELTATALRFRVSSAGTAGTITTVTSGVTPATGQWYFVCGRFRPGSEMVIWVNGTKTISSGPASAFSSTADFTIGSHSGGNYLSGRVALPFLCRAALYDVNGTDAMVNTLYALSRPLFNVKEGL